MNHRPQWHAGYKGPARPLQAVQQTEHGDTFERTKPRPSRSAPLRHAAEAGETLARADRLANALLLALIVMAGGVGLGVLVSWSVVAGIAGVGILAVAITRTEPTDVDRRNAGRASALGDDVPPAPRERLDA